MNWASKVVGISPVGEDGRKSPRGLPVRTKKVIRVGELEASMEPDFPWKEK